MREKLLTAIREHVIAEYPREACGVVVQQGRKQVYIPCRNVAEKPEESFTLSPDDYIAAEKQGEILMIVHSHPDVAVLVPSETDRIHCDHSGLEWGIMSWPDGDWCTLSPRCDRDYVGRPWVLGHADCWSLIVDYYRREYGITLRNWSVDYEWWNEGRESRYDDNWQDEGFVEVPLAEMRPGDMIMFQSGAPVTNHAALYQGDNIMLHHGQGNLSNRVPIGAYWRERIVRVVRHRELINA
ncbi:C40 family peptidase [Erwinia aphidicola]|uniref:C40 family peptidase n=1 Tax=Erwinia aphidicola TaxID=68334 RepID=UPI0030176C41